MAKPFLEKNGKTWAIRPSFTLSNGKYTSKYLGGYATKREAQLAEGEYLSKVNGEIKDMRFFRLCDFFIETKIAEKRTKNTIVSYQYYITILKEELGDVKINQVTTAILQLVFNKHSELPSKLSHLVDTASAVFTFAFNQDLIEKNPIAKIKKPSKKRAKPVPRFDVIQLKKFLLFLKKHDLKYYCLAFLSVTYGLRPSEAVAVMEEAADTENWRLTIDKTYDKYSKKVVARTKTEKSTAILPMNKAIYEEVTLYKKTHDIQSNFLCCNENGDVLTPNGFYQFLRKLFGKTQKSEEVRQLRKSEVDCDYITPYGFRHTFSNINKRRGENTFTIGSIMRHDTPLTTEEHYFDADDELNRLLINKYSEIILQPETA